MIAYVVLFSGRAAGATPLFTLDRQLAQHDGASLIDSFPNDRSDRGPGGPDAG